MAAIDIMDVYLRDGLQDEPVVVATRDKLAIAEGLVDAGLRRIELGSFVNPARVPQMGDAAELFAGVDHQAADWHALALNGKGVDRAVAAGARHVEVVASASQGHSSANAGRSVEESLEGLAQAVAAHPGTTFVAGISTAFSSPFDGDVDPDYLLQVVRAFTAMGITEIGLADTVGTSEPGHVLASLRHVMQAEPGVTWSLHLHDAHGRALETVTGAIEAGVHRFDAALAGYGGCPFAPGAHGNLATEVLVRHVHALGHTTGIDEGRLARLADQARQLVETAPTLDGVEA